MTRRHWRPRLAGTGPPWRRARAAPGTTARPRAARRYPLGPTAVQPEVQPPSRPRPQPTLEVTVIPLNALLLQLAHGMLGLPQQLPPQWRGVPDGKPRPVRSDGARATSNFAP